MINLQKFISGPTVAVHKLNEMVTAINSLNQFAGDGLILVNRTVNGYVFSLNIAGLKGRLVHNASGGDSHNNAVPYRIIEAPIAPTAEDPIGQDYYTLRLTTDTTEDYSPETDYSLGDFALDSTTDLMYESIKVDAETTFNTGHDLTDTEWWSQQEEIRISEIWGYDTENSAYTFFNFVPLLEKDAIVYVFSYGEGEDKKQYIDVGFMFVGAADERTIIVLDDNNNNKMVSAVFV